MFSTDNLAGNCGVQLAGNCIMIEPPKPIKKFVYLCDRRFHIEHIEELYQDHDKYGIIIIGGDGVKFYEICGTEIKRITRDKVKLPKNQRKGGQSAPRFGRIREEMIDRYIGQCNEVCCEIWLTDGQPNIKNMVIAGIGDKKDKLFDDLVPCLKNITRKLCLDASDDKIIEKALEIIDANKSNVCSELETFFKNIEIDNDRSIYGMEQMKEYLEEEKLEKILIHENINNFHQFIEDWNLKEKNNLIIIKKECKNSDLFLKGYGGIGGISYF